MVTITAPVSTSPTPPSLSSSKNSGGRRSPATELAVSRAPRCSSCAGGWLRSSGGGEGSSITRCTPSPHTCPSVSQVSEQLSKTSRNSGSFSAQGGGRVCLAPPASDPNISCKSSYHASNSAPHSGATPGGYIHSAVISTNQLVRTDTTTQHAPTPSTPDLKSVSS